MAVLAQVEAEDEVTSKEPLPPDGGGRAVEDNRLSVPSLFTEGAAGGGGGGGNHDDLEYGRRESLISTAMVCSRRQSGAVILLVQYATPALGNRRICYPRVSLCSPRAVGV